MASCPATGRETREAAGAGTGMKRKMEWKRDVGGRDILRGQSRGRERAGAGAERRGDRVTGERVSGPQGLLFPWLPLLDLIGTPSSWGPHGLPHPLVLAAPGLSAACVPPTDGALSQAPPLSRPCSHRDLLLVLLQPQGEVSHLDGDHSGHTDCPTVPLHILLQDGKLAEARPGPARLRQRVHTGAHEVEAAAVEGGVMRVSRRPAGGRAHGHAAQNATGRLAGLVWAAGGGLTGHQAALLALAKGIAARSGIEGLARRVVGALVHAAAGGEGHAGLTAEREALVAHTALVAGGAAAPGHREVSAGQRAAAGARLVVAVGRAAQRCRESGHQDGESRPSPLPA